MSYVLISHKTVTPEPGKLYSQHIMRLLISLLSWLCFSARVQSYQIQVFFCSGNKILLQWTRRNVHINQHEVDSVEFFMCHSSSRDRQSFRKCPWFLREGLTGTCALGRDASADPLHMGALRFCRSCFSLQRGIRAMSLRTATWAWAQRGPWEIKNVLPALEIWMFLLNEPHNL